MSRTKPGLQLSPDCDFYKQKKSGRQSYYDPSFFFRKLEPTRKDFDCFREVSNADNTRSVDLQKQRDIPRKVMPRRQGKRHQMHSARPSRAGVGPTHGYTWLGGSLREKTRNYITNARIYKYT